MTLLNAAAFLAFALTPPEVPKLDNPGFESGEPGRPPVGWTLRDISATQGFTARLTTASPATGKLCLELARDDFTSFGPYAAVSQSVPAESLRGKRVRFTAKVRTGGLSGYTGSGLFARVHRPDFRPGHCTEMNDKPERGKEWVTRSVVVDVAADAERVEVGFVLHMAGTAWFDDAALEVLGPAGVGNDPPAPLSERGRVNVEAFAKLLAYVRFFHPSDGSAATDWGKFAIEHVAFIEGAKTPAELAARLGEAFAPVAPTLRVFAAGTGPAAVPELASQPAGAHVVAWRHVGGDPNGLHGRYRHKRVADRDVGDTFQKSPDPLPKPADVYEAELGGGVACRVPTALFADGNGTLPKATAKSRPPVKPADFPPTGDDRATRLACACLAWGVFQHFYPYFEETRADWPAALSEAVTAAATDPDAAAFNRTIRRLVARLQDSHGAVRPGSGAARSDGALPFAWDIVEGKLAITWVDPKAKLKVNVGDVVEALDDSKAEARVKDGMALASGATPEHRRYRTCAELRIGPSNQPVKLELRTPTGEAYRLTLPRTPSDDSPLRGPSMREPTLEAFARPAPGVVYLDLDRLGPDKLFPALVEARKAEGVVLDLRGYPQVYMVWMRQIADKPLVEDHYFDVVNRLPDRRATALERAKNPPIPPQNLWKARVAFVTDGRAVSAAETFLAVVENTKLGTIVGEPTAGSNGGVALYVLPDGTRVSWTGQKVTRADGTRLHGVGIRPAVPVARTLKGLAAGRDEALERAIELVRPAGPERGGR